MAYQDNGREPVSTGVRVAEDTKQSVVRQYVTMTMQLTPQLLLHAYSIGAFPMADSDEKGSVHWYAPDPRAILPLESFHVSRNLQRLIRREPFEVATDRDFEAVIRACSQRDKTWISEELMAVYTALHELGFAHSVECREGGRLVGGLYGVALGGAFFGESMFHRVTDASKVALVHLVRQLRRGGYLLLDTQFVTAHLERFGVTEIPREEYERRLERALTVRAVWWPPE
jgi:leucyl/phenylalanyl-tRNA---protein transferase